MKTVTLNLEGLESNAFALISTWRRQAKREGWTPAEIAQVTAEAQAGDYDHLLRTLIRYTN